MIREPTLYYLNYFKFVELCFVAQDMVCLEWFMGTECILLLLGGVFYICQLDLISWVFCSNFLHPCCFLSISSISCWEEILKSSTKIEDLSIYSFSSISFPSCILRVCCFLHTHLGSLFFWWIDPFIIM